MVSYQLRTNYLNTIKDGVGERLITITDGFLNTSGFKSAGWRSNPAYIKRVHSPPIPTAIASEYFQAPRATGVGLEDEQEEGGMVTGGGIAGETFGAGVATKRRRRREQMEEEDSSDLSDDSDDDGEQRAAQQIKFAKMPVRTRSGSSPARASNTRESTIPQRTPNVRRGSQSALEAVKARARRDTVTSSEFSSDNEIDNASTRRTQAFTKGAVKATKVLAKHTSDPNLVVKRQQSDLLEEEEDESDGSEGSSAFPESMDSASILDGIDDPMASSPIDHAVGGMPRQLSMESPKKARPAPPALQALPPPRPISMIQSKSLLSAAIRARRTKSALPFESFASLSGKGDPNPLRIRIWAPFTKSSTSYFEVLMRRTIHESGGDRQVTVADLIGLSLWRYQEEKLEPPIPSEKLNVNRWVLRLIDDDEVDYDFPALERTNTVVSFTTVNNARGRVRAGAKNFDEFGLVEATDEQFEQNKKATPQFHQEAVQSDAGDGDDDLTPKNTPQLPPPTEAPMGPRLNPVLVTRSGVRSNVVLADMPNTPLARSATRTGIPKLIRVYINTIDTAPGQMVTIDITTDAYLAEVLDLACKKRQLDKANHVLKIPNSGTVVLLDRTVESIGNIQELELVRRRFATDGPLQMTGSPIPNQSGMSPRTIMLGDSLARKVKKTPVLSSHPLKETIKQDEVGSANYRRYIVWRKKPMAFVSMNERAIVIDGEYLHIMPASTGKTMFDGQGKTTTVHFSNVVGCKVTRRHPTSFKVSLISIQSFLQASLEADSSMNIQVVVYRAIETKRYDFDAKSPAEAFEIVSEIKKGCSPYHDD